MGVLGSMGWAMQCYLTVHLFFCGSVRWLAMEWWYLRLPIEWSGRNVSIGNMHRTLWLVLCWAKLLTWNVWSRQNSSSNLKRLLKHRMLDELGCDIMSCWVDYSSVCVMGIHMYVFLQLYDIPDFCLTSMYSVVIAGCTGLFWETFCKFIHE